MEDGPCRWSPPGSRRCADGLGTDGRVFRTDGPTGRWATAGWPDGLSPRSKVCVCSVDGDGPRLPALYLVTEPYGSGGDWAGCTYAQRRGEGGRQRAATRFAAGPPARGAASGAAHPEIDDALARDPRLDGVTPRARRQDNRSVGAGRSVERGPREQPPAAGVVDAVNPNLRARPVQGGDGGLQLGDGGDGGSVVAPASCGQRGQGGGRGVSGRRGPAAQGMMAKPTRWRTSPWAHGPKAKWGHVQDPPTQHTDDISCTFPCPLFGAECSASLADCIAFGERPPIFS